MVGDRLWLVKRPDSEYNAFVLMVALGRHTQSEGYSVGAVALWGGIFLSYGMFVVRDVQKM